MGTHFKGTKLHFKPPKSQLHSLAFFKCSRLAEKRGLWERTVSGPLTTSLASVAVIMATPGSCLSASLFCFPSSAGPTSGLTRPLLRKPYLTVTGGLVSRDSDSAYEEGVSVVRNSK